MKRKIYNRFIYGIAFLLTFWPSMLSAQDIEPYRYLRKWDIELGGGMSFIFKKYGYENMKTLGPSLYAELRHNPSTYPVKLGGQLSLTMNERGGKEYYERHYTIYTERLKFVSWNALAIAELPIFLTIRTDMYASVGVGIAGFIVGNEKGRSYTSLCFMPRVGIDFNHRFRLALYYKAERKQFNHLGLSVGFILGGRFYARPARPSPYGSTFAGSGAGVSY